MAYGLAEIAAGLPETVWAAAVPANYDRQICELIEDIYGDHMYLVSAASLVSILSFFFFSIWIADNLIAIDQLMGS